MTIEQVLHEKQVKALKELRGMRKPKTRKLFKALAYLGPEDFLVTGYKKSRPFVAFNPAAYLDGDDLLIFPRFIFDYYKYVSSVGMIRVNIEKLLSSDVETPIESKIILWPVNLWEFLGCEDPRAFRAYGSYYMFYTGKGYFLEGREYIRMDVLGLAEYDDKWRLKRRGYFTITHGEEKFTPKSNKDSAFIKTQGGKFTLLTRPEIKNNRICWRGLADIKAMEIEAESLEPVLVFEDWELKVGWSTNAVPLSNNEYLVGWHGVVLEDLSYRDGLAVVDGEGRLLAISDYLIEPRGLIEEYGDRPLVVFGDGLVSYKDYLLWIGGISDYAIAIFIAERDKVLEELRWIR